MPFQSPPPPPRPVALATRPIVRATPTLKRPRIDDEHLKKQEIDLQNAILYAASIDK